MERKVTELIDKAVSRRSFLAGAGAVAAGSLAAGCSNRDTTPLPAPTPVTPTPTYTDADYLNFALNLEYLEAEFYLHAATGTGLSTTDTGNATSLTTVIANSQLTGLTALQSEYLNEIAQNELDHVRFLRAALGPAAITAPAIDLTASFNGLATLAGLGSAFNPFDNYNDYLIGAFIFEDVGVTAYHGAAPLLTDKGHLTAAAEIHAVEAYHAASIRSQIVASGSATLLMTANAVQAVRAKVGGGMETTLSATTIVAADPTTSIGFKRTPEQVLAIVYAGGTTSGGFFPQGLNGNIKSTAV